jgi:hypothetical protein
VDMREDGELVTATVLEQPQDGPSHLYRSRALSPSVALGSDAVEIRGSVNFDSSSKMSMNDFARYNRQRCDLTSVGV